MKNIKEYEEYDWNTYTQIYSNQILDQHDTQSIVNNAKIINGKLELNGDVLHPNFIHVVERILEFNPKSVFECGFGGGQNIYSIRKLFPDLVLGGAELLQSQVDFGRTHFNIEDKFYLDNQLFIGDFSIPNLKVDGEWDMVYTNAVIMHLNTFKAIEFIKNMIGMSPKYIVMNEGDSNHDWVMLWEDTKIEEVYFSVDYQFPWPTKYAKDFIRK